MGVAKSYWITSKHSYCANIGLVYFSCRWGSVCVCVRVWVRMRMLFFYLSRHFDMFLFDQTYLLILLYLHFITIRSFQHISTWAFVQTINVCFIVYFVLFASHLSLKLYLIAYISQYENCCKCIFSRQLFASSLWLKQYFERRNSIFLHYAMMIDFFSRRIVTNLPNLFIDKNLSFDLNVKFAG